LGKPLRNKSAKVISPRVLNLRSVLQADSHIGNHPDHLDMLVTVSVGMPVH
jgi:hypothetical protein